MAEEIDDLTPEQEAKLDEYVSKYNEIGLKGGPIDEKKIENWSNTFYL